MSPQLLATVGLLFVLIIVVQSGPTPNITLYSSSAQQGTQLLITEPHYDLGLYSFDNMASSYCGIGLWMFYTDVDYAQTSRVGTFASYIYDCYNLQSSLRDQVSSIRYAGTDNLDDQSLTLYQFDNLCGAEYLIMKDMADLNFFDNRASSFVVIGNSSWTLYYDVGYTGGASCVVPYEDDEGWFYGVFQFDEIGLDDNTVSSVRKGCFSSDIITYEL